MPNPARCPACSLGQHDNHLANWNVDADAKVLSVCSCSGACVAAFDSSVTRLMGSLGMSDEPDDGQTPPTSIAAATSTPTAVDFWEAPLAPVISLSDARRDKLARAAKSSKSSKNKSDKASGPVSPAKPADFFPDDF